MIRVALGWLFSAVLLAPTSAAVGQAPETPTPPDRSLTFAWPVPSDVEVTEEHKKRGRVHKMSYRIELRAAADAEHLVVHRRNFRFLEIDGKDVTGERHQASIAPLVAQLGILPNVVITRAGEVAGIENWDDFQQRAHALLSSPAFPKITDEIRASTLDLLRQPDMQELQRNLASEFWGVWVGAWVPHDFRARAEHTVEWEFPVWDGIVLTAPLTVRHLGAEPGTKDRVWLSMRSRLHGQEVTDAMRAFLRRVQAQTRGAPPLTDDALRAVEILNETWVLLRPDTMQPFEAQTEKRMSVDAKDGQKHDVERRHYWFRWS